MYLAETAPPKWRGAFTTGFQLFLSIGNLAANLVNYGTARISTWGWRPSLGLAAAPAAVILAGALLIPDTPSSLLVRGRAEEARAAGASHRDHHTWQHDTTRAEHETQAKAYVTVCLLQRCVRVRNVA